MPKDMIDQLAATLTPAQLSRLNYAYRDRLYADFNGNPWCEDAVRNVEFAADSLFLVAKREEQSEAEEEARKHERVAA